MNADEIFPLIHRGSLIKFCKPGYGPMLLTRRIIDDMPHIESFCETYSTELSEIVLTQENGAVEPMYVFHDNTGGYTIDGVRASL